MYEGSATSIQEARDLKIAKLEERVRKAEMKRLQRVKERAEKANNDINMSGDTRQDVVKNTENDMEAITEGFGIAQPASSVSLMSIFRCKKDFRSKMLLIKDYLTVHVLK